jgi:hypothetical protein
LEIWVAEGDYFEGDDDGPIYVTEDAAKVVYENISDELKEKLDVDDIIKILEVEFEYQQKTGLVSDQESIVDVPRGVEFDAMEHFIIHECVKSNIILTHEEFLELLEAETIYLDSLGLIDDEGI